MTWECSSCTFLNDEDHALRCIVCGKPNPLHPEVVNGWECECGQRNPEVWQQCTCKRMKPAEKGEVSCNHCGATNNSVVLQCTVCGEQIREPVGWTCKRCTFIVAEGAKECTSCGTGKDGNDAKRRKLRRKRRPAAQTMDDEERAEGDQCFHCDDGGMLVMCDGEDCQRAYHAKCIPVPAGQPLMTEGTLPFGDWYCPAHDAAPAEGEANSATPAGDGPALPGPVTADAAAAQAVATAAAAADDAATKAAAMEAAAAAAKALAAAAVQASDKAEADAAESKAAAEAEARNAAQVAAAAMAAAEVEAAAAAAAVAAKAVVVIAPTEADAAADAATAAEAATVAAALAATDESSAGIPNVSMLLVAPGGQDHCNCAGIWTLKERQRCLAQMSDAHWCTCADKGTPDCNARRSVLDNKCKVCKRVLHEIWRFREPTSTILRFMLNHFMTDDAWSQDAMAYSMARISDLVRMQS